METAKKSKTKQKNNQVTEATEGFLGAFSAELNCFVLPMDVLAVISSTCPRKFWLKLTSLIMLGSDVFIYNVFITRELFLLLIILIVSYLLVKP